VGVCASYEEVKVGGAVDCVLSLKTKSNLISFCPAATYFGIAVDLVRR
jgi:hypothetical protein